MTTTRKAWGGGEGGFSLIEVMVVIIIAGILVSIVWLRLAYLAPRYRLEGAARDVAAELQKARGRAIAEGKCMRVSFNSGNKTYALDTTTNTTNCSTASFTAGTNLKIDDSDGITIDNGSGGPPASAIFNPRGGVDATSTIAFRNNLGDARLVLVNSAGRVSVQ